MFKFASRNFYLFSNVVAITGAGNVSHSLAIEKARGEYLKFQNQNLSPVEEAYLDTIKAIDKTARQKSKRKSQ